MEQSQYTGPENGSGSDAQAAFDQAKDKGREAAQQASSTVRSQIDDRSTQAGQQISTQASDIRTVADKLREEGKDGPAKVAEQAAQRVERVGSYLEQSDSDRILGDVEDFARSNPWAVVAGGLAAGFLASRFLRASSSNRSPASRPSAQRSLPSTGATSHGLESPTTAPRPTTPVPPTPPAGASPTTTPRVGV